MDSSNNEIPFSNAGFFSRMSFWWLNPLMKKGKKKILEDDDLPMLRKKDRAETCYTFVMEQLEKQKEIKPSILCAIMLCYLKEVLASGFFAFLKIVTLSASPLFLSAFIDVAEGKEAFKHEGYVLDTTVPEKIHRVRVAEAVHNKFQSKLVIAQDKRLKAISEAMEPITMTPDIIAMIIHAEVAFRRIEDFLGAEELDCENIRLMESPENQKHSIYISSGNFSWEGNLMMPTLRSINLEVKVGDKVAICGEVGAGKSTLLAAILGEVPKVQGTVQAYGKIAYVLQMAWIQSGSIQDNILFGCTLDKQRYQETIEKCSLVKDLGMLPFGDLTEIGERGINLSGVQKQRIQLARALYHGADIYLLDDPFSAVDTHTAISIFNECIMGALSGKTVLLVTHQVDFFPTFDSILLMSDEEIQHAAPYHLMLSSSRAFCDLFKAHKDATNVEMDASPKVTRGIYGGNFLEGSVEHQLIEEEERETGDTGWKPYLQYLNQNRGFFYFSAAIGCQVIYFACQILQNYWMAANAQNSEISFTVVLGMKASESIFDKLLSSLFHAPIAFYEATPLGRIISRVSSDLSIVDLDLPANFVMSVLAIINTTSSLARYYFASAKEFMRINGTTKSMIASHLGESISGAITIRAFRKEGRFFTENLNLIDRNAGSSFHIISANEWLIQRLETLCAIILCSSALVIVLLPKKYFGSGFIGMTLSYGFVLYRLLVFAVQYKCALANDIISMERLNQYMHIPSEAPEVIEANRPLPSWPVVGRVEILDFTIRYRVNTPIVLHGISCTFEGGHKVGIVGRTGSGKSTLTGALFRLVEPVTGKIIIDGIDISTIAVHDLRARLAELMGSFFDACTKVLGKCQLRESVQDKEEGLDSSGVALLRGSQILVLDEATASIDNTTDAILQKTIRTEFEKCTVITVAHRIPTIMDSTKVLAISDGKIVEYDEPMKLATCERILVSCPLCRH
ncbi:hypothetical protein C5167_047745 [Papaver somniferum]|uniref:ABC transporter domain-containing protein n=1 Tax=Papaver somniferum TaxID=3469 RepID=A0A4Y7LLH0_PAPSO|nr:hypothetical protein C5167_047745 [Papaver somniferum]